VCIAQLCFKVSAENFERVVVYRVAKTGSEIMPPPVLDVRDTATSFQTSKTHARGFCGAPARLWQSGFVVQVKTDKIAESSFLTIDIVNHSQRNCDARAVKIDVVDLKLLIRPNESHDFLTQGLELRDDRFGNNVKERRGVGRVTALKYQVS